MKLRSLLILIAAIAFALGPFVSSFNGFDPSLYPIPQTDPEAQPAGYAFSIWGVIYLWLIVHGAVGFWARSGDPAWDQTRLPLLVSLAVGAVWLPVAEVSPVWATMLILVMAAGALMALYAVRRRAEPWVLTWPIALYAGWLTAASLVSIALLGGGYGVLTTSLGWGWIAVLAAFALAAALNHILRVPVFLLPIAWALIAVAVQNGARALSVAAVVAALVLLGLAARDFRRPTP